MRGGRGGERGKRGESGGERGGERREEERRGEEKGEEGMEGGGDGEKHTGAKLTGGFLSPTGHLRSILASVTDSSISHRNPFLLPFKHRAECQAIKGWI